jgi:hypothetical protein
LLLARGKLPPDVQERAWELLAGTIHWDRVLTRAHEHQVFPLVYRSLRTLEFHHLPAAVRSELTAAFRINALRNAFLSRKLAHLLRELSGAGIPVIPVKGLALSQALYGDPAFRVCSDIDILIPAQKVLDARRLILTQGYKGLFSEDFFVHHQLRTSAECSLLPEKQEPFIPFLVELRWTILHHSSKDRDAVRDLWSEARRASFFGVSAHALSPEWEFLFLAQHAAYHKWHTLKWLADIHDFCMSVPVDWRLVKEKAECFELDLAVVPTLAACASLFGTPLPNDFSSSALPAGIQLFPNSLTPEEIWKAPLFYRQLLKRRSEKLRWFAEMLLVARPADRRFFRLPAALSFLYYLLRPLRLSIKWSWLFSRAGFRWVRERFRCRPPGRIENPNSEIQNPKPI